MTKAERLPKGIGTMSEEALRKLYPIELPSPPFPKTTISYDEAVAVAEPPLSGVNAARLVAVVAKQAAKAIVGDWKRGALAGRSAVEKGLRTFLGDVSPEYLSAQSAGVEETPEEVHESAVAEAVDKYARKYVLGILKERISPDAVARIASKVARVFGVA